MAKLLECVRSCGALDWRLRSARNVLLRRGRQTLAPHVLAPILALRGLAPRRAALLRFGNTPPRRLLQFGFQDSPYLIALFLVIALHHVGHVQAETRTAANYTITTDALDSGAASSTASYTQQGALCAIAGISTATLPDTTTRYLSHGFIAQLVTDISASAQSNVVTIVKWAGGAGDWSDPNNWSPPGVPGPAASVTIADGTVNVTSHTTVGALTLTNGTLRGPATLTVAGAATWSGGLFVGPGTLVITQGATLTITSPANLQFQDGYILENHGTIRLAGPGWLYCDRGAIIENRSNSVFDIQSDAGIYRIGFVEFVFNNHPGAIFRKSGGTGVSGISFGTTLQNDGLVEVQSGTLEFGSTLVNSGTINVAAGATASYVNSQTFQSGSILSGLGTHRMTAGNSTFSGQIAASNFELAGGELRGTFTNTGNILWTGGVILGKGALTIPLGATLTVSSTNNLQLQDGYILDNSGTIALTGPAWLACDRGATIENRGLFDLRGDVGIFRYGFDWFAFNNHTGAVLRKSAGTGTGGLGFGTYLVNDGIIDARSGVFSVTGDYAPSPSSSLNIYIGGAIPGLEFSQLQVSGAATLNGTLNVALMNGFVAEPTNVFRIVSAAASSGTFAALNVAPSNAPAFEPVYQPTGLLLKIARPQLTIDAGTLTFDNTGFRLRFSGDSGATCIIQAATRLSPSPDWTPVSTNVFTSGQMDFLDPNALSRSQRFYRVLLTP